MFSEMIQEFRYDGASELYSFFDLSDDLSELRVRLFESVSKLKQLCLHADMR